MTPAWMSGYVSDVAYTLGFYRELAPSFLNYVCVINGVEGIPAGSRLRYCELGCGRGYGTTLLAAANPDIEFVGIDFNPLHINEARAFASRADISNITFIELSFADAARSTDPLLAEFDIVALHGVFSWVDPRVQNEIIEFLRARLVSGGLAYVSYNTLPGWAVMTPLQRILKEYAGRAAGDSLARIDKGLAVLKVLADKSSAYIAQNPAVKARVEALDKEDQRYLVHEFLQDNFQPLYITDALESLAEAKLTYVGSANIGENRLILCVPKDLIEMIQSAPDLALRELLKDYVINKQFRRDVYAKGRMRLSEQDVQKRFHEIAFALTSVPNELEKWPIPSGEALLKPRVVEAIVSRLRQEPATGRELIELGVKNGIEAGEVPTVLEILIHNHVVVPCRLDFAAVDRSASQRLNDAVIDLGLSGDTHRFLAAPVLGSAIGAGYFERVAASILREDGEVDDATAARVIFDRVEGAGMRLSRDGKPIDRNEQNLKEIAGLVSEFRDSGLLRWRNLGALG